MYENVELKPISDDSEPRLVEMFGAQPSEENMGKSQWLMTLN